MSYWIYMLRCADDSYYIGYTDDLACRVDQHHDGTGPGYTHERRPVELVWVTEVAGAEEASRKARRISSWSRAHKEALINRGESPATRFSGSAEARMENNSAAYRPDTCSRTEERTGASPVIVLVRPQLGENIGKAARAMLNFGLAEMRLVAPRDGWPNPSAGPAAAGADEVLERASLHDTLAEAVSDCAHVYATTVRKRGLTKPVVTPEQAVRQVRAAPGRSAIVFGPERSGLETDEIALARSILTVPINPEFASLNLAQAVILCAYEWSKGATMNMPTVEDLLPPAPQSELEGLIGHFEALLEPKRYFWPESRAEATRRTLRSLLTKPGWNSLEVRTLRGVLSTLAKTPRARG